MPKISWQFSLPQVMLLLSPLSLNWRFKGWDEIALFLSGQIKISRLLLPKVGQLRNYPHALLILLLLLFSWCLFLSRIDYRVLFSGPAMDEL